jgi:hypothetical protein
VYQIDSSSMVKKKPGLYPLCIRFRSQDLEAIRLAATKQGEVPTVWLRGVVMLRVVAIEEQLDVPKLKFDKTGTLTDPISVRFRAAEYRRAARAATQEGCPFSHWARAIALEYIQRGKVPSARDRERDRDRATAVGE